jgi:hypothetical protein
VGDESAEATQPDDSLPPRKIEIDLNLHIHWPDGPLQVQFVPYPRSAVALTMKVSEVPKMSTTFTVDTTDGVATLSFVDDHGDPTAGPNDSIDGTPVVPVVSSDTTSVLTAAPATAGATPGSFVSDLVMVAEGTANLSVAPLTNSDGSPVVDSAGNPFGEPAPVEVTVTAGDAADLTMAVTG